MESEERIDRSRLFVARAPSIVSSEHANRFHFKPSRALMRQPPPQYLIEQLLVEAEASLLVGRTGEAKTYVVADILESVLTGTAFHGLEVRSGAVAIVLAEGHATTFARRLEAWLRIRALEPEACGDVHVLDRAVNMLDLREVTALLSAIREECPNDLALIVIDTLARCFVGGDENSARDMGLYVAAVDLIREQMDAHVLTVHHTGVHGDRERGSSALGAAFGTHLAVRKAGDLVTLRVKKQREGAELPPIHLELRPVELQGWTSAALVDTDRHPAQRGSDGADRVLEALRQLGGKARRQEWLRASGLADSSFKRVTDSLIAGGRVVREQAPGRVDFRLVGDGERV